MPNWEKTLAPEPKPEEGSGVRKKPGIKTGFEASDQELNKLFKDQDKRLENYPEDPWEETAPVAETDPAKVWGQSEDLDAEDREHSKKLAKQLMDMDEATKDMPEDEMDKALKKRAS